MVTKKSDKHIIAFELCKDTDIIATADSLRLRWTGRVHTKKKQNLKFESVDSLGLPRGN